MHLHKCLKALFQRRKLDLAHELSAFLCDEFYHPNVAKRPKNASDHIFPADFLLQVGNMQCLRRRVDRKLLLLLLQRDVTRAVFVKVACAIIAVFETVIATCKGLLLLLLLLLLPFIYLLLHLLLLHLLHVILELVALAAHLQTLLAP